MGGGLLPNLGIACGRVRFGRGDGALTGRAATGYGGDEGGRDGGG